MHYNVIYIRSPQVDPKYLHEHPTTKEKPCFPAQPPERTDRPRSLTHLNAFKRIQMYSTELIMLARMAKLNWSPHTQRIQTYLTNLVKSICMVKSHRALLADTLNGFKRVGRLHLQHVWTHSNAFERIQTHSYGLTIFVPITKSYWVPTRAGPRRKLPHERSVGNRFTSPCLHQLTREKNTNRAKYFLSINAKYKH